FTRVGESFQGQHVGGASVARQDGSVGQVGAAPGTVPQTFPAQTITGLAALIATLLIHPSPPPPPSGARPGPRRSVLRFHERSVLRFHERSVLRSHERSLM